MESLIPVVVVDDEEILLDNMADWLARAGSGLSVVATAQSVDELLAVRRRTAAVVLLDLRLRDGRSPGDNVTRLVAAGFVVVACSSRDNPRWIREAIQAGAHSYVRKAKDPTELHVAIAAAANGDRYTSRARAAAMESATGPNTAALSGQEREVLRLYASGMTINQAAEKLHIKASTAKSYLDRVRDKYEEMGRRAHSKLELHERAVEDGVLPAADAGD